MADALTITTDIVKGLGDVPSIPQAIKAFEGTHLKTKVIEAIVIADDIGKIVGIFMPPVAVIANDVGIAIEVYQAIDPIVGPVVEKLAGELVDWVEHEFGSSPPRALTHKRTNMRPLLLLAKA